MNCIVIKFLLIFMMMCIFDLIVVYVYGDVGFVGIGRMWCR